jgi:hypothetical protein
MLSAEQDLSRQLTLAGVLWKIVGDPIFIECLKGVMASDIGTLKAAHVRHVLWLDDARAIDILIELLDDRDRFVRFFGSIRASPA